MQEHLKTSEAELNELLAEYCKLRHQTGNFYLAGSGSVLYVDLDL
jgi:hypothetical protein